MIITLAGHAGTGKTTVGKLLEKKLGYQYYYTGGMVREMAAQNGMTVAEFQDSLDGEKELDEKIDAYQKKLGEEKDNIIVDGHIAFHFIPHSFKVKLIVDPEEGARRIYQQSLSEDRGNEKKYTSLEEAITKTETRNKRHHKRWFNEYGITLDDLNNYDLVIDSTNLAAKQVVDKIMASLPKE